MIFNVIEFGVIELLRPLFIILIWNRKTFTQKQERQKDKKTKRQKDKKTKRQKDKKTKRQKDKKTKKIRQKDKKTKRQKDKRQKHKKEGMQTQIHIQCRPMLSADLISAF